MDASTALHLACRLAVGLAWVLAFGYASSLLVSPDGETDLSLVIMLILLLVVFGLVFIFLFDSYGRMPEAPGADRPGPVLNRPTRRTPKRYGPCPRDEVPWSESDSE